MWGYEFSMLSRIFSFMANFLYEQEEEEEEETEDERRNRLSCVEGIRERFFTSLVGAATLARTIEHFTSLHFTLTSLHYFTSLSLRFASKT